MRRPTGLTIVLTMLIAASSAVFFLLPSLRSHIFLSPDETAVVQTAKSFGKSLTMRIADPVLRQFSWIHPRSFVAQGDAMVPVGFLGFPFILGLIWILFRETGMVVFTPMLAISVVYPLWMFTKQLGKTGQIATVLAWLSFPTVVLYANRGFFPNLPVVCLMVWAVWLIWDRRTWRRGILAGLAFGLALSIRPVEAIWAMVWMVVAWKWPKDTQDGKGPTISAFLVSCMTVFCTVSLIGWYTYGSPFLAGYLLRDTTNDLGSPVASSATMITSWPFDLHLRSFLFNIRKYFFGYIGPWVASAVIAAIVWIRRGRYVVPMLGAWTAFVICIMYAGTVYQDHIGSNVASIGNSFLRYALPLTPFFAVSVGAIVSWIMRAVSPVRSLIYSMVFIACIFFSGSVTAMWRDDEGLESDIRILLANRGILTRAVETMAPRTIIVSDRSDKIFFPIFRVASPIPDLERVSQLVADGRYPVAYFGSSSDQMRIDSLASHGILSTEVFVVGNMAMYSLQNASSSQHP